MNSFQMSGHFTYDLTGSIMEYVANEFAVKSNYSLSERWAVKGIFSARADGASFDDVWTINTITGPGNPAYLPIIPQTGNSTDFTAVRCYIGTALIYDVSTNLLPGFANFTLELDRNTGVGDTADVFFHITLTKID
jgi:hypothetical protein